MKMLISVKLRLLPEEIQQLESMGLELTFLPDEMMAVENPEQYEAAICFNLFKRNELSKFTGLKYIQLSSAGTDHLPLAEIRERGIVLNNARGVYSVPMAEFALCGVLQLYKRSAEFHQYQQEHKWQRIFDIKEIAGKQVCVVGVGSIGNEMAKRFAAFDAKVVGVDIARVKSPYFERIIMADKLEEVLAESDIVVLTLPLLPGTRHMFDAALFSHAKPGAIFVNVARGAIVEQAALVAALQSGRLGGAVLDVFEEEPLASDSPLWDMPNVLVTPHNSFKAESNDRRMFKVILENLQNYLQTK